MTLHNAEQRASSERPTWWSLVGGIGIWALHLMIVYPLTSLTCERGLFSGTVAGMPTLQFIQIVATVIAALLIVVLGFLSWRAWRRERDEEDHTLQATKSARRPLMAFVATVLNGFFLLAVLMSFVPVFVMPPCG